MQRLELKERKVDTRMVNSNELLAMGENNMSVDGELYDLAMRYEDLYFLINGREVIGIAIPTHRPLLLEKFKNKKPIRKRSLRIIEIIENGMRQEYILIML